MKEEVTRKDKDKDEETRKDKDKDEETKKDEDEDKEDTTDREDFEDTTKREKAKTKRGGRHLVKERRVKVIITIDTNWHHHKCKTLTPKVCSSGEKAKEYKLPSIHRYIVL